MNSISEEKANSSAPNHADFRTLAYQLRDELGWSIIPIQYNSKKAAVPWKQFQSEHPNDSQIDSWWGPESSCGIAVVTGKISDLTVIDVDSYKPGGARFPLEPGESEIPWTVTSRTGSGGIHYFFKYNPDIPTASEVFTESGYPNVDTRNEGGYIVLPPSSNENGQYVWINAPYGANAIELAEVC